MVMTDTDWLKLTVIADSNALYTHYSSGKVSTGPLWRVESRASYLKIAYSSYLLLFAFVSEYLKYVEEIF